MFEEEFARAEMTCIPEQLLQDGEWDILKWKDPLGLRGWGFFRITDEKIVFQWRSIFKKNRVKSNSTLRIKKLIVDTSRH